MGTTTKGQIGKEDLNLYNGVSTTFSRKTSSGGTGTYTSIDYRGIDILEVYGSGTRNDTIITNALNVVGTTTEVTFYFSSGTWTISNAITFTSNINLSFAPGALLQPAAGITVTVYSPEHIIASPRQQIIDTTNNSTDPLAFTVKGSVYPEWWGTFNQSTFQLSLDANGAGGETVLPAGSFTMDDEPIYYYGGATIRSVGGRGSTTLTFTNMGSGEYCLSPKDNATQNTYKTIIRGFTLTGESTAGVNGIGLIRTHRSTLKDIRIHNIGGKAFVLDGTDNGTVLEGHYNVLERCQATGTHTHGFVGTGGGVTPGTSNRNTFIACRDNGASIYSVSLDGNSGTNQAFGFHQEDVAGGGIYLNSNANTLYGVIQEDVTTYGVTFDSGASRNIVSGRFSGATSHVTGALGDLNMVIDSTTEGFASHNQIPAKGMAHAWVNFKGSGVTGGLAITGATAADPVVITSVGHGLSNDDIIYFEGETGMVELNKRIFMIKNVAADTLELYNEAGDTGEDGTGHTAANNDGEIGVQCDEVRSSFNVKYVFVLGTGSYLIWFITGPADNDYTGVFTCSGKNFAHISGTDNYKQNRCGVDVTGHAGALADATIVTGVFYDFL